MNDTQQPPPNGAPLTAEQLNAAEEAVSRSYANAVLVELHGQINPGEFYAKYRLTDLKLCALLDLLAANGLPLPILQAHFIDRMKAEVARITQQGPKIAIATGMSRKQ